MLSNIFHLKKQIVLMFLVGCSTLIHAQIVLEANGPGNTYELINSVLAPNGGDVVESAECAHPEFGRHIAEVWDAVLSQYVFEFYIHVAQDNDRCINFDRQRVEIKTYDASPANLKGTKGETVVYKWLFKVPTGFQPSSNFTHIHQVKAVGGDESDPLFVLTARKGSPNKLELNYYESSDLSSVKFTSANLSLFENTWVEATERIKINNIGGTYSITIKKVSDGSTVLSYSNSNLLTIRSDNSFIRPKWGIYRSLLTLEDLRDESLRFAGISINEESISTTGNRLSENTNQLKIFPNQQTKTVVFEFSITDNGKVDLDICGLNGQIVKKLIVHKSLEEGTFKEAYDVSGLKTGLYIVRLYSAETISVSKLLIL